MAKRVIIIGFGGNSREICELLLDSQVKTKEKYTCVGFLDDNKLVKGKDYRGVKVLGDIASLATCPKDTRVVMGVGSPSSFVNREKLALLISKLGYQFLTLIHASSHISPTARIEKGAVIMQRCTIGTNVILDKLTLLLPNTVIGHDSYIGKYTIIASSVSISGTVHVGNSCYIGAASVIREGRTIHDNSLVGMGSVVVADVSKNTTVVGNPAKIFNKNK